MKGHRLYDQKIKGRKGRAENREAGNGGAENEEGE